MYMIMFVLDDSTQLEEVLNAWIAAGVGGATIIDTSGLHRQKQKKRIPMPYAYSGMQCDEECNTTLFAIVESQETVNACLEATESVTGDLDDPNTGVFTAWPLAVTKGIKTQGDD